MALAGCLGGSGSPDDDGATPTTAGGSTPTTTPGSSSTTTAASVGGCDALTAEGYRRYDAAGKPIFFTFDRPAGWRILNESSVSNGYLVNFERTIEVGGETTSAILGIVLSNRPLDEVGYDSFVDQGWEERTVALGGTDHQFVLSPMNGTSRWRATGALTHGRGAERPYYAVSIDMTVDDDGNCLDQSMAIRDRLVGSVVPNDDNTFAPAEA